MVDVDPWQICRAPRPPPHPTSSADIATAGDTGSPGEHGQLDPHARPGEQVPRQAAAAT